MRPSVARGDRTTLRPETAALPEERSFIPLLDAGHNCLPDITAPVCLRPVEGDAGRLDFRTLLYVRINTKLLAEFLRTP